MAATQDQKFSDHLVYFLGRPSKTKNSLISNGPKYRTGHFHQNGICEKQIVTLCNVLNMKNIIYGAFGRYNFGDLLFPHILTKLIKRYDIDADIEYCDILSRDLVKHGGFNVKSITDFFEFEENINVVHAGGETGGCNLQDAINMFEPEDRNNNQLLKLKEKGIEPAYLLKKSDFVNPNIFIANSIGGRSDAGMAKLKTYDYVSFRDHSSFSFSIKNGLTNALYSPDSAILTKSFFSETIRNRSETDLIKALRAKVGEKYIAVQMKRGFINSETEKIHNTLQKIIFKTNLPLVFFAAGTVSCCDSFDLYRQLSSQMAKDMFHIFDGENIWDVCNIISNAEFVIGTSLHVRILSMQYLKPRVTFALKRKHQGFIEGWDNIKNININLTNVVDYMPKAIKEHDYEADRKQLSFLEKNYLHKSTWLNLLNAENPSN